MSNLVTCYQSVESCPSDAASLLSFAFSASVLRVSEKIQTEMLVGGLAELLMKVADGNEAVFCVPGTENCFEPTAHYGIDGITEKVRVGGKRSGYRSGCGNPPD